MAHDSGPERRGRRWRTPALVLIAGAHSEGMTIARRLLDVLPSLVCPTVVSIRAAEPAALRKMIHETAARAVTDGDRLANADVWVAPADRNTVVSDGILRTDAPGHRVGGHLPSLGALYHSVRVEFGSRVFAVVADPEHSGGANLRLLRDRGACIVRPLELEPSADMSHWSIPTIVDHLTELASATTREAAAS